MIRLQNDINFYERPYTAQMISIFLKHPACVCMWLGWVGFYGISTIVGHLALNLFLYVYIIYIYILFGLVWFGFMSYQPL